MNPSNDLSRVAQVWLLSENIVGLLVLVEPWAKHSTKVDLSQG